MVKSACFSSFLCNEKHIVNGNPWVQTQRGNVKPLPLTPHLPFSSVLGGEQVWLSAISINSSEAVYKTRNMLIVSESRSGSSRREESSYQFDQCTYPANGKPPPALSTLHPLVYLDAQSLEDAGDAMSIQEAESTWQARPFQIAMTAPPFYPCSSRCPQ